MTRELRYKVGVFNVKLIEAPEDAVRPFDDAECECEEFARLATNVHAQTHAEKKCRHIREAELFHHYRQRVEPAKDTE